MLLFRSSNGLLRITQKRLLLLRTLGTEINVLQSPGKRLDIPENVLLQNYMLEHLQKWNNKVALECIETNRSYTYEDLWKKTLVLAQFLKNEVKLDEKDTIGVLLPNIPEFPIIFLGALKAGLTITTINPYYTPDEIKKQLIHAKCKALFTSSEMGQEVYNVAETLGLPVFSIKLKEGASLRGGTVNLFEIINSRTDVPDDIKTENITSDDIAFLPYSSGTTGASKGVELTHKNIIANLEQAKADGFNTVTQDETALAFLPFYHIYGLSYILLHRLSLGSKLITFPKFSSQSFIKSLRKCRPTFIPSVPPIVHLIMVNPEIKPSEDLASVRLIISGAAPLAISDIERFQNITKGKTTIIQAYGMTEMSPLAAVQSEVLKGGMKVGGSGFLVPNTEGKIIALDDSDSEDGLGPNESGQLLIRGPQVMRGYLNNLEGTREILTEDNWLKTGDIGHYDEDGHIFITDRLKDLIKVKGFQVTPTELEAVLRLHPSVVDVAVIGIPHSRFGEAPKAFVVPRKNSHLKPEDLQKFMATKVAEYKQLVGGIDFVDAIPRNPSGKILRKELKKFL